MACSLLFAIATVAFASAAALAAAAAGRGSLVEVTGTVTGIDGVPVDHAVVSLLGGAHAYGTTTGRNGKFDLDAVSAGDYTISVTATGYAPLMGRTVAISPGGENFIQVSLSRGQVSSLVVLGNVRVNGTTTLSTAPAPVAYVNAQHYAAQAVSRVSDVLMNQLSTTVYPVLGGGLNAPAVVALRGPDPSETLVDVDGHQVNNGNTGDFDLSLLDPAELQSVQVVYGIAPSALFGPNTLGGALNVQTIEPSSQHDDLERLTAGSYNTFGATLLTTGTDARWGYALAVHRLTSGGQLDGYQFPNTSSDTTGLSQGTSPIGNGLAATNDIAKLRYSFGNGGFVGVSYSGQSVYRDLSATLSSVQLPQDGAPFGQPFYVNFSGSSTQSHASMYGLDLQLPLGAPDAQGVTSTVAIFRHQTSLNAQAVNGPAAGTSPYLFNDRDLIADDTLEVDRVLPHSEMSLKAAITQESLSTDFISGVVYSDDTLRAPLGVASMGLRAEAAPAPQDSVTASNPGASVEHLAQTQRWVGVRYTLDPTTKLHYSLATYVSNYSTFGHSIDPRFGFVWTPTAETAVRASVGTTFQSPQLPTFIVPPVYPEATPCLVGYCVSIGNPHATAERSTNYDLGAEHIFRLRNHPLHVGLDVYRTDLHNGVATFYAPLPSSDADLCPVTTCYLAYPANVSREVYQGAELRSDVQLSEDTLLLASYDIDSVFTKAYPAQAADDVLPGEQSPGVPLHKWIVSLERNPALGLSYYAGVLYEGEYNELGLPPFATLRAGITWHGRTFDVGLAGENLTGVYNFKVTHISGGIVYGGLPPQDGGTGPTAADALPLPGPQITLILTRHV